MVNKPFSSYFVPLYQNESMKNLSYENGFVLYENESVGETLFHMNGYVQRLVLTQRQKSFENSPIIISLSMCIIC